jgi:hypothetical protein
VFVTVSVWANPSYQRDDVRGLAHALGKVTVPRAIVVTPASASVPLRVYMQPFAQPGEPVMVREIDLAALPIRNSVLSGAKPPPRKPNYVLPVPGMRLVEQRFTKKYSLLRYRSAKPIEIGPPALLFNRLDPRSAAVIYQR